MEWRGTATDDIGFLVSAVVRHGRNRRWIEPMTESIAVRPRRWSLPERSARNNPKWVDSIPERPKSWGIYKGGEPSPRGDTLLEKTAQGSGPWAGTWILDEAPTIAEAALYFHKDLESGGPEYPVTEEDDCWQDPGDVSVYGFNESCGEPYKRALATFRGKVIDHENRHETSLNECIKAVNTDGRLAKIEAIVSTSESDAKNQAKELWTDDLVGKLLDAKKTAQGPDTAYIYHWRKHGEWRYGGITESHSGKEGCPNNPAEQ